MTLDDVGVRIEWFEDYLQGRGYDARQIVSISDEVYGERVEVAATRLLDALLNMLVRVGDELEQVQTNLRVPSAAQAAVAQADLVTVAPVPEAGVVGWREIEGVGGTVVLHGDGAVVEALVAAIDATGPVAAVEELPPRVETPPRVEARTHVFPDVKLKVDVPPDETPLQRAERVVVQLRQQWKSVVGEVKPYQQGDDYVISVHLIAKLPPGTKLPTEVEGMRIMSFVRGR